MTAIQSTGSSQVSARQPTEEELRKAVLDVNSVWDSNPGLSLSRVIKGIVKANLQRGINIDQKTLIGRHSEGRSVPSTPPKDSPMETDEKHPSF